MASLREHVAARTAQTMLSNVDSSTFQMALSRTAEVVEHDLWKGKVPTDDEFVMLVCDRLEANGGLTEDEYKRFRLLRSDIRRSLALSVRLPVTTDDEGDAEVM